MRGIDILRFIKLEFLLYKLRLWANYYIGVMLNFNIAHVIRCNQMFA